MIQLTEDYAIDTDKYNFVVKEKKVYNDTSKHAGETYWADVSYHATHKQMLDKITDLAVSSAISGDFTKLKRLSASIAEVIEKTLTLKRTTNESELRKGHENRRHRSRRGMDGTSGTGDEVRENVGRRQRRIRKS